MSHHQQSTSPQHPHPRSRSNRDEESSIILDKSIDDNNIDALPVANVHDEFQYQVKKVKLKSLES